MSADLFGYDSAREMAKISSRAVGIDEVGLGPLAGPVVAAAVVLDPARPIDGLKDSKKLTAAERRGFAEQIRGRCLGFAYGRAEAPEIDRVNILEASLLAMRRALEGLRLAVDIAYVDGNVAPALPCRTVAVVGGDDRVPAISAASILAKVLRDDEMAGHAKTYPEYGFEQNKGYATQAHLDALRAHGPTPLHRRSFTPVGGFDNALQLELV